MARRAENYILSITAGPTYQDQRPIPINTPERTPITSPRLSASLAIRIQNYRGLPANSPSTSPYFSHAPHTSDLYSLEFSFTLKNEDINGNDLVFGNDFDHPIRDKLPPGFNQAFNLVKWFVDPGLYGDVYAEEPYLYGPLLSSMNVLRVGAMDDRMQERVEEVRKDRGEGESLVEGGEGDGVEERERLGVPGDAAGRKKWFLTKGRLEEFTFEKGREYENDFFNPYLDFNGGLSFAGRWTFGIDADMVDRVLPQTPRLGFNTWHHDADYQLLGWAAFTVSTDTRPC